MHESDSTPTWSSRTLVCNTEAIHRRIQELGCEITAAYSQKDLVLVVVLSGGFLFAADLCRAIALDLGIDFIRVASYGSQTESSGKIELRQPPKLDLNGKDILLVEDIVDTGLTVQWLVDYFRGSGANSVKICALIDKQERRQVPVTVDYIGFSLDKGFLVGYGLDYDEHFRNLPAIYSLDAPCSGG